MADATKGNVVADSPLMGGGSTAQHAPKSRFDSPGQDTPQPTAGLKPRPELDTIVQRRPLYSLTRLPFVDVTPEQVQGVIRDLEVGRLERPADFWAKCLGDAYVRRADWTRRASVANRPISVEPNKSAPSWKADAAQANAKYAQMVLASLQSSGAMEQAMLQQLCATVLGLAVARTEWEMRDGWWMPQRFVPVLARDIRLDLDWTPLVRDEWSRWHRIAAHPGRFWCHRPETTNGLLVDQGTFRGVAWLFFFKTLIMRFRMFAAERFGTPLMVAYVEQLMDQAGTVNASVKNSIISALKSVTVDTVMVAPNGAKVDIIDPKGTGSAQTYKQALDDLNNEIQVQMLGMTTMFAPGANGSRSAEETRNGVRLESTAQDSRLLLGSFVRDVIAWGIAYNGLDPDPSCLPTLATIFDDDIKPIDATALSAGIVKNNEYRKALGLPAIAGAWGEQFAQAQPNVTERLNPGDPGSPTPAPGGAPPASPFAPPRKGPLGGMPDLSDPRTR